jgi:hypothetical protein
VPLVLDALWCGVLPHSLLNSLALSSRDGTDDNLDGVENATGMSMVCAVVKKNPIFCHRHLSFEQSASVCGLFEIMAKAWMA